jgi:hypothetical protein
MFRVVLSAVVSERKNRSVKSSGVHVSQGVGVALGTSCKCRCRNRLHKCWSVNSRRSTHASRSSVLIQRECDKKSRKGVEACDSDREEHALGEKRWAQAQVGLRESHKMFIVLEVANVKKEEEGGVALAGRKRGEAVAELGVIK